MGKGLVDLQSMGQRIKHLRCSMNYTQERFAAQINISTSYLALLETCKRMASIDVLAQIVDSFHISLDFLLFGKEEPLETKNYLFFQELCRDFSNEEIASALKLAEFYLKNIPNKK